ncbi:MAG: hypothetical protein MI810_20990 [Flavobacteriales bacterium]|nr:hypothetical protein [Flavobacteriales bacterium]
METKKRFNPQQLFLIDGFGALLSAFLLGIVLVQMEDFFGIPEEALYALAILPCFFALYDFYCYRYVRKNQTLFLTIIALINLVYCVFSLGMAFYHSAVISFYGWGYVIGEVMLILMLVILEFKMAKRLRHENKNSD